MCRKGYERGKIQGGRDRNRHRSNRCPRETNIHRHKRERVPHCENFNCSRLTNQAINKRWIFEEGNIAQSKFESLLNVETTSTSTLSSEIWIRPARCRSNRAGGERSPGRQYPYQTDRRQQTLEHEQGAWDHRQLKAKCFSDKGTTKIWHQKLRSKTKKPLTFEQIIFELLTQLTHFRTSPSVQTSLWALWYVVSDAPSFRPGQFSESTKFTTTES